MPKKTKSESMTELLARLSAYGEFQVVIFPEECFSLPVSEWPIVDCLISFFSRGFPLDLAEEYVALRKPYCVNDLTKQRLFFDRDAVYKLLRDNGVPTPNGARPKHSVEEFPEHILIDGHVRLNKPVVEKPLSGEDHNIYVYYPESQGGGVRKLFRKVKDCSSKFEESVSGVRRDGEYLYEEFYGDGVDIKVYAVGTELALAESRKSPTVDGVVIRDLFGKEVRHSVRMTDKEKQYASTVSTIFGQTVCGFDILRSTLPSGEISSCVIDVNGFSFVKGRMLFFDNCARQLRHIMLEAVQSSVIIRNPSTDLECGRTLLGVVAVLRHADRTPKQKIKFKTSDARLLEFFNSRFETFQEVQETRFKSSSDIEVILGILSAMLEDSPTAKLAASRSVLLNKERGLKVQLKPGKSESSFPTSLTVVVKWGGEITAAGIQQSLDFGAAFRNEFIKVPNALEFCNDVRILSSDEDRVKECAKHFSVGFCGRQVDSVCNAETRKILEDTSASKIESQKSKDLLDELFKGTLEESMYPAEDSMFHYRIKKLGMSPADAFLRCQTLILEFIAALKTSTDAKLQLMQQRWEQISDGLADSVTKLPDVYDCAKYEAIHWVHLLDRPTHELFHTLYYCAWRLSCVVVPQEYGFDRKQKGVVANLIARPLASTIVSDVSDIVSGAVRCSLLFTSESFLQGIRNYLVASGFCHSPSVERYIEGLELNYLAHCVFQVYGDDQGVATHVRILVGPGAVESPFAYSDPVTRVVPVSFATALGVVPIHAFPDLASEFDHL